MISGGFVSLDIMGNAIVINFIVCSLNTPGKRLAIRESVNIISRNVAAASGSFAVFGIAQVNFVRLLVVMGTSAIRTLVISIPQFVSAEDSAPISIWDV